MEELSLSSTLGEIQPRISTWPRTDDQSMILAPASAPVHKSVITVAFQHSCYMQSVESGSAGARDTCPLDTGASPAFAILSGTAYRYEGFCKLIVGLKGVIAIYED